jgi:hypothetical protein
MTESQSRKSSGEDNSSREKRKRIRKTELRKVQTVQIRFFFFLFLKFIWSFVRKGIQYKTYCCDVLEAKAVT